MTRLLTSAQMETLANEESVRGVLVRKVLEQAQFADEEELALLEKALELLLERFKTMREVSS